MQVVGIGFESTNVCDLEALCISKDDGGILKWNSDAKFAVYRGTCAQSSKQLAITSYLFELVFELASRMPTTYPNPQDSNHTLCTEREGRGLKSSFWVLAHNKQGDWSRHSLLHITLYGSLKSSLMMCVTFLRCGVSLAAHRSYNRKMRCGVSMTPSSTPSKQSPKPVFGASKYSHWIALWKQKIFQVKNIHQKSRGALNFLQTYFRGLVGWDLAKGTIFPYKFLFVPWTHALVQILVKKSPGTDFREFFFGGKLKVDVRRIVDGKVYRKEQRQFSQISG